MRISKYKLAVIGLIVSNIIWGASAPIFKWSLTSIEPMTLGFFRFFIASLLILPFVIHKIHIKRKDALKLFFVAFIGAGLNIGLTLSGLKFAPSINSPVINSSAPIFLILGSIFFLKEKIQSKTLIGTLISMIGVLIVVLQPLLKEGFNVMVLGNVFFVIATFALISYTLLLKRFNLSYSPLTITFWLFVFATVWFFIFMLFESHGIGIINQLDGKGMFGILFGGIFTSAMAYGFYNFALKQITTNEVGIFLYVDPVIAALIAIPLLHEAITFAFLLGTVLVFLGIFVAEGRLHYHPIHRLKGSKIKPQQL